MDLVKNLKIITLEFLEKHYHRRLDNDKDWVDIVFPSQVFYFHVPFVEEYKTFINIYCKFRQTEEYITNISLKLLNVEYTQTEHLLLENRNSSTDALKSIYNSLPSTKLS